MLQIISVINWLQAVGFLLVGGWIALESATSTGGVMQVTLGPVSTSGSGAGLGVALGFGLVLLGAPFAYLGAVIEKGRGRGLQTVMSVLAFFAFPVGTAFSLFTLYALWFSPLSARFEGGAARSTASRRASGERSDAALDEVDADAIDDAWPEDEPAYAYARRMADAGMRAGALRARLRQGGVDPDDVETLLGAVGLVRPGAERARPTARRAATPGPRTRPPAKRR
ncbi:MAG: hypothetical protein AB1730_00470 [Myxococcota bacterium]|jgi:hypothetical protein